MTEQEKKDSILRHYHSKDNRGALEHPAVQGHMVNRSCGDEVTIFALIENGTFSDIKYTGAGCSLCIASADMVCTEIKGQSVEYARKISEDFLAMLDGSREDAQLPGDVPALLTLKDFPMRQKCATMSWKIILEITG